jgi:hypothetical protein
MTPTTPTVEKTTGLTVGPSISPFLGDPISSPVKPVFCGACGKSMQDPKTDMNVIGMSFKLPYVSPTLLDPYKPEVIYSICFPCWMKSLGIKP